MSTSSLFESLFANAPDTVIVVDRDHRVLFINRTRGPRTVEDVVGHRVEEFVPESHRQTVRQAVDHVFETGQPTSYLTQVETPDGERWHSVRVGPVILDGNVTHAGLISTDVTAEVASTQASEDQREALRQSEERFRTLVEYAPEAMTILDVDTGRFVDVNENACRLFSLSREHLVGQRPGHLSPEYQPDGSRSEERAREWVQRAMDNGPVVFEWYHRDATGRVIPCEVRLVRLPNRDHHWVRGSIIDITERKRADAERDRLSTELAQAQKLQAIGQLTGGVAHDFNNLLTVIMSSLELIELRPDSVRDVLGHVKQALAASERAAALTRQLLAFARRQPLRPQVVNLNDLAREAEALLHRTLGEGITIETRPADGLWPCETDPTQFENAILNLAINGRDAMPEGGTLTIETANVSLGSEDVSEHRNLPGDYVMLAVTDQGTGMDPAVLRHAFEPFFTTKETGRGSGLGLSMVYGFVNQSGGHVTIDSEPGRGTAVRIYLPRSRATPGGIDRTPTPETAPRGRGERVLVVEDDAAVRTLVVENLESLGYRVLQAGDTDEAMATLQRATAVDLLLTDVALPGDRNGPALAGAARQRHAAVPVIYMSGYSENALARDGRLDADVSLLEKPFTRIELAVAVRQALNGDGSAP